MARSFDEADRLDAEDSLLELRTIVSELVSEVRALAAEVRQRLPPSKQAPQPVNRNRVPPPIAFERVERIKKRKARK